VVYGSDMAEVRSVLEQTAREMTWRHAAKDPLVLLLGFGSSSVDWEVSVWIDDPWRMQRLRSDLNESIWWALKGAGITIAFPQLDVHLDSPIMESIEVWSDSTRRRLAEPGGRPRGGAGPA
jgi:small-conductance mechanosensitive channel